MSVGDLLVDLARLGIRLEACGGQLRYSPRSAITPDLADRLNAHTTELLAILQPDAETPSIDRNDAAAVWQAALDQLDGDPLFPPKLMEGLRAADVRWVVDATELTDDPRPEAVGSDGWPLDSVDPDELDPCRKCGMLELWQTLAGNWRCQRCDPPPEAAERFRNFAAANRQPWPPPAERQGLIGHGFPPRHSKCPPARGPQRLEPASTGIWNGQARR